MVAQCPINSKKCMTLHMLNFELPDDHFKFADHDSRIVPRDGLFPWVMRATEFAGATEKN